MSGRMYSALNPAGERVLLPFGKALRPRQGQLVQPVSLLIWLSDLEPLRAARQGFLPACSAGEPARRRRSQFHVKCKSSHDLRFVLRRRISRLPADTRRAVLARSI